MAIFILRFVLENGTNQDYTRLKFHLEKAGFTKIIKSDLGQPHILPHGMYLANTEKNKNEILDIAIGIAKTIRRKFQVLVTESGGSAWIGLPRA